MGLQRAQFVLHVPYTNCTHLGLLVFVCMCIVKGPHCGACLHCPPCQVATSNTRCVIGFVYVLHISLPSSCHFCIILERSFLFYYYEIRIFYMASPILLVVLYWRNLATEVQDCSLCRPGIYFCMLPPCCSLVPPSAWCVQTSVHEDEWRCVFITRTCYAGQLYFSIWLVRPCIRSCHVSCWVSMVIVF